MLVTDKKTRVILNNLRDVHYLEECSDYGEKGYSLPEGKSQIAFANWNPISKNIQKYLELIGYELQWSDEWIQSYETSKCYRVTGDCYSWKPYYFLFNECEVVGGDEIEEDEAIAEEYINEYLLNNCEQVNLFDIDKTLFGMGFSPEPNNFESGWYGENDSPEEIAKSLTKAGKDFVFSGLSNEQFRSNFSVWTRPEKSSARRY